jgi:hypothetical protein
LFDFIQFVIYVFRDSKIFMTGAHLLQRYFVYRPFCIYGTPNNHHHHLKLQSFILTKNTIWQDKYTVSVSALLLATKIEEAPRRVDLLVVHAFALRAKQIDGNSTFTIHDPVRLAHGAPTSPSLLTKLFFFFFGCLFSTWSAAGSHRNCLNIALVCLLPSALSCKLFCFSSIFHCHCQLHARPFWKAVRAIVYVHRLCVSSQSSNNFRL